MAQKININEIKNGQTFKQNDNVFVVLASDHSKSGRGQAHVKVKVKNLFTNATTMITFTGGDKVEKAFVKKSEAQFIYREGDDYYFMNNETFEQVSIPLENIKWQANFIDEGSIVKVTSYEEMIIGIELETNITLSVKETADAVRGNTVSNATKKAVLSTGYELDVPQFVNIDDKIVVNSDTGKYVSKG